jgi:hypothetical protein
MLVAVIELIATAVGRLSFYCAHRLRHREKLVWSIITIGEYLMCIVELTTTFVIPLVAHQQPFLLAAPSSSFPTLYSTRQHCPITNTWGGYLRGQSNRQ